SNGSRVREPRNLCRDVPAKHGAERDVEPNPSAAAAERASEVVISYRQHAGDGTDLANKAPGENPGHASRANMSADDDSTSNESEGTAAPLRREASDRDPVDERTDR